MNTTNPEISGQKSEVGPENGGGTLPPAPPAFEASKNDAAPVPGKVYSIDFARGALVPLENPGLAIGQIVTYEDRANPRKEFAVVSADVRQRSCTSAQPLVCLEDGHRSEISFADGKPCGHWTVTPRTLSREELAAALATAEAARLRIAAEEKTAADVRAEARAKERADLLAQYSPALSVQNGTVSSHALGAKNLKKQLAAAFPGVKFSVKSNSYSGGDSIDVSWDLGPLTVEVEKISGRYQEGHFDGMEDIYNLDRDNQWPDLFGGAKYVSENRHIPADIYEQAGRALCALQGVTYDGQWTRRVMGENDDRDLGQHVNLLFAATPWPVGAVFKTVESTDDGDAARWKELFDKYGQGFAGEHRAKLAPEDLAKLELIESHHGRHWCRIVFETPAATAGAVAMAAPVLSVEKSAADGGASVPASLPTTTGAKVVFNREKNGVEIHFPSKPDAATLATLKAHGWRWSRFSSCWYARRDGAAVSLAVKIGGLTDAQSAEVFGDKPAATEAEQALGFKTSAEAAAHEAWLDNNGSPEFKAWKKEIVGASTTPAPAPSLAELAQRALAQSWSVF